MLKLILETSVLILISLINNHHLYFLFMSFIHFLPFIIYIFFIATIHYQDNIFRGVWYNIILILYELLILIHVDQILLCLEFLQLITFLFEEYHDQSRRSNSFLNCEMLLIYLDNLVSFYWKLLNNSSLGLYFYGKILF